MVCQIYNSGFPDLDQGQTSKSLNFLIMHEEITNFNSCSLDPNVLYKGKGNTFKKMMKNWMVLSSS